MALLETVRSIMAQAFDVEPADIPDDASMDNVENWDSLNHIKLITDLEKRFSVRFNEESIVVMVTMGDILRVLAEHGVSGA